jgi:hypothetical protein
MVVSMVFLPWPFRRRPAPRDALVSVLLAARELLQLPGNSFDWSSWKGPEDAVKEIDELIEALRRGETPKLALEVLFAPTGPIQEVSVSSGWAQEFLDVASRFDSALERLLRSENN